MTLEDKVDLFRKMLDKPAAPDFGRFESARLNEIAEHPDLGEHEKAELIAEEMSRNAMLMKALSGTFDNRFDVVFDYEQREVSVAWKIIQNTINTAHESFAASRAAVLGGFLDQTSTIRNIFGGADDAADQATGG